MRRFVRLCVPAVLALACSSTNVECEPETPEQFCQERSAECGTVTGTDACGIEREYTCGQCEGEAVCGGGGPFRCGVIQPVCSADGWCWDQPLPSGHDRHAIWGASPNDIWTVGAEGTVHRWNGFYWLPVPTPTTANLNGVWGFSARDVWAVGDNGVALHWDGSAWSVVATGVEEPLNAVWGASANDLWVVGGEGDSVILHWNGSAFSAQSELPHGKLYAVWGSGPNDVWAGGTTGALPLLLRYSGGAWTKENIPVSFKSVTALGGTPKKVFMMGEEVNGAGTAFTYNGKDWVKATIPPTAPLHAILTFSETDAWAVGDEGTAMRWNGQQWQRVETGARSARFRGVFGKSNESIWAAGLGGVYFHFDGTAWTPLGATDENLYAVLGTSDGRLLAAGDNNALVERKEGAWKKVAHPPSNKPIYALFEAQENMIFAAGFELLLAWDGTLWSTIDLPAMGIWKAIWAYSLDGALARAWLGGRVGTTSGAKLLHYDGNSWSEFPLGSAEVRGIWACVSADAPEGSDPLEVWTVGGGGNLFYKGPEDTGFSRAEWTPAAEEGTTNVALNAILGFGCDDIWVVGDAGTIVHYDGEAWLGQQSPTTEDLYALSGTSSADLWAVGARGTVLHFDGTTWVTQSAGAPLRAVWAGESGEVWAVGDWGAVLRR